MKKNAPGFFSNLLNATVTTGNDIRSLVDSIDTDRTSPS